MDPLTLLMVGAFVLGVLHGLRDHREEPDAIEIARPSIHRLEAEALRAAEELRQLNRGGE